MKKIFILATMVVVAMVAQAKSPWKAKHVILIGIDGWGGYSVAKAHDIPNLQSLMTNGAWTAKTRSVLPSSSAINWASMFNGAPTEIHGYTQWGSRKPEIPSAVVNSRGIFPSVFTLLREKYPKIETGCIAEWDGIKYLVDSLTISYVDVANNYEKDSEQLCRMAESYIKEKKPAFAAICFDQLDHVGHGIGHDTPEYYDVLVRIDKYVGRILQAVKDADIYDETIFIVTADHGGKGKGHGGKTLLEMEHPFIICGKSIKQGMQITDVMMQYDTAATIAEIFGLQRPQAWRGVPIYSVFKR